MNRTKFAHWRTGFFALGLVYAVNGLAQNAGQTPNVERLNRNLSGPGVVTAPAKNSVKVQPATTPELKSDGRTMLVSGFQFNGVTAFPLDEIMDVANARLNQSYDLAGLQRIANSITTHYRDAGYLVARAWLAPQVVKDNVVVFQVYEGHLSKSEPIRVVSKASDVNVKRVTLIAQQSVCPQGDCVSQPLTQERVDRAALLVTEIMGYQVKGELVPGKELGTATMVLHTSTRLGPTPGLDDASVAALTAPRQGYAAEVSADNFGAQATGVNRVQGRLALSDFLQDGDQVGVSYMTTNKTDIKNYALDYSVALGDDGWRLGAGAGKTQYTLANTSGGYAGDATTANLYLTYPVVRSTKRNIDFRVDVDRVGLSDESVAPENRRLHTVRAGVSGDFQDQSTTGLAATTAWGVGVAASNLKYDDGRSASTVGQQNKYTARLNRTQNIDQTGWYVDGNVYGQQASGNLDSYGKLFLGGASAVRAYAGGEVGGDTAWIGQFALGKAWSMASSSTGQGIQTSVSTFYDRGWARLQENPSVGVTSNQVIRSGWGLETKISQKDKFSLRAFWAEGRNGVSTVDGKKSRIGLSVGLAF